MTVERNKQVARKAVTALMSGDLSLVREVLAPHAVLHQCGFLTPIPARDILEGRFPGRGRVADREIALEDIVGEGDIVALRWRTSGTVRETDSTETGKPVSFPSMSFLRFEDGRIAEIWNIQDVSTLQAQLDQPAAGEDVNRSGSRRP